MDAGGKKEKREVRIKPLAIIKHQIMSDTRGTGNKGKIKHDVTQPRKQKTTQPEDKRSTPQASHKTQTLGFKSRMMGPGSLPGWEEGGSFLG